MGGTKVPSIKQDLSRRSRRSQTTTPSSKQQTPPTEGGLPSLFLSCLVGPHRRGCSKQGRPPRGYPPWHHLFLGASPMGLRGRPPHGYPPPSTTPLCARNGPHRGAAEKQASPQLRALAPSLTTTTRHRHISNHSSKQPLLKRPNSLLGLPFMGLTQRGSGSKAGLPVPTRPGSD